MKSKKNIIFIAIALSISAMIVLSGCNLKENSKLDESKTNDSQITEIAPEESKDNYEKGTLTDTSFESKYLNLKFDLPEGYTMFTEQQLFEKLKRDSKLVLGDLNEDEFDYVNARLVYEMVAKSTANTPSIIISIEKLDSSDITEQEYLSFLKENIKDYIDLATVNKEDKTVELAGQNYLSNEFEYDVSGQKVMQDYYLRRIDRRMVQIIITYTEDSANKDILINSLSALE